ncbi:MAG: glycine/betaine ABC transporter permease, partial [Candidatus Puniceispirillaceae bacterium]
MGDRFDRSAYHWFAIVLITLALIGAQPHVEWLAAYPSDLIIPFADWLNAIMDWLVTHLGWLFMGVSWLLEWPIKGVRVVLQALPWSVTGFLFCLVAYIASGWRLALFTLASCLYMVIIGYWPESMNTLSLVAISVPMAILFGFGLGVW